MEATLLRRGRWVSCSRYYQGGGYLCVELYLHEYPCSFVLTSFPIIFLAEELPVGALPYLLPSPSLPSPYPNPLYLQIPFLAEELPVEVLLYLLPIPLLPHPYSVVQQPIFHSTLHTVRFFLCSG
jgi:hypothetical protein